MNARFASRRAVLTRCTTLIAASVAGCVGGGNDDWMMNETIPVASATQFQGPDCDCCDVYADYLQYHMDAELAVTVVDDLQAVKVEYGIPLEFWSCHTVIIDTYVVEGHMPVEVISNLLKDEPKIDGIALPGMPTGSPGMGGQKNEEWTVYEIRPSGDTEVFQEI